MVGSEVVGKLAGGEHEIRVLSRRPPADARAGVTHRRIDLVSREGIDDALAGVDTVIDAGNERRAARKVLVDGTADLLERCREAGVRHYVGISIVGCERLGLDYYVAKTAQEKVIESSPIGWSLLRATQFHELIDFIFATTAKFRFSPVASIPVQPVAAAAVAAELARLATGDPTRDAQIVAGPQVETLRRLSKTWRAARGKRAQPLPVGLPGRTGRELRAGALTDPAAAKAGPTFQEWLAHGG